MSVDRKMKTVLQTINLRKIYGQDANAVAALRGVSLTVDSGEFVAVVGPSGCGKSTFLHLCGGMDRPTEGRVVVGGVDLNELDDEALTRVRREQIGFVFQSFNLLPTLTLVENIALPVMLAGNRTDPAVSDPRASRAVPSCRLTPAPLLEPPDTRCSVESHGFRGVPQWLLTPNPP